MDQILNGNNNFLVYKYNVMEEYDYWCKAVRTEEVSRWRDKLWDDRRKVHLNSWYKADEDPAMELDKYGLLKSAIQLYIEEGMYGYIYFKSFSSYKARMSRGDNKLSGFWDRFRKQLYEYNGVKDVRGYMINISPKWPVKYSVKKYASHLERAIVKFAKTGKWKEFHYTLECGKNGDHLHAHCVCIPTDPAIAKSYIGKGNHANWFKRELDNKNNKYPVGFVGCVKGRNAIQVVQINNHEIYKDKLEYLQEETKPEDHQNKSKMMDKVEIDFT